MVDFKIVELITRRRHQILVHSAIYYEFDNNLIDDTTFDEWSRELVKLTGDYQKESEMAQLYKEFKGFDGSTGAFLPYDDYRTLAKAESLIEYNRQCGIKY